MKPALTVKFENKNGKEFTILTSNLEENFTHYYIFEDSENSAMLYSSLPIKQLISILIENYPPMNSKGQAYLEESQKLRDLGVSLV